MLRILVSLLAFAVASGEQNCLSVKQTHSNASCCGAPSGQAVTNLSFLGLDSISSLLDPQSCSTVKTLFEDNSCCGGALGPDDKIDFPSANYTALGVDYLGGSFGTPKYSSNLHLNYTHNRVNASVLHAFLESGAIEAHNGNDTSVCVNNDGNWSTCLLKSVEHELWCVAFGAPYDVDGKSGAYCGYYYQTVEACGCISYDGASSYENIFTIVDGKLVMDGTSVSIVAESGTHTSVYHWVRSNGDKVYFLEELTFSAGGPIVQKFGYYLDQATGIDGFKDDADWALEYSSVFKPFDCDEHLHYAIQKKGGWDAVGIETCLEEAVCDLDLCS